MRRYAIPLMLLLLLSGCSRQTETPTDKVYVPDEVPPVYVDLPNRVEEEADLVFSGWVTPEGDSAQPETDANARYRDVSELENVLAIPSEYAQKDDVVSLPLRLCGQVELCAFDVKLTYDKNRLEYLGCEDADDDLMVHAKPDEGVVRINYLYPRNLQEEKELCRLQFRVTTKEQGQSLLHMEVVEAVSLGSDGDVIIRTATPVHSTVWLNQEAGEGG